MNKLKLIFLSFLLSFQLSAFDEFLVSDIRIIGLQRVSTGSIFNVIPVSVGDRVDKRKVGDIHELFLPPNSLMIFKLAKNQKL